MRTTRAFIAGLGTTASLLAATACAFLVTSALVAFNSWPGGGIADSMGSLFVQDGPVTVGSEGPEAVAAASTVVAEAVVSTTSHPVSHPASFVVPHGVAGVPGIAQVSPVGGGTAPERSGSGGGQDNGRAGGSPVAEAPTPPAHPAPSARSPDVGTSVSETTAQLGDTVSGTTNQVGAAVGGPAGDTVQAIGQAADEVVTGVGQNVGGAVGQK